MRKNRDGQLEVVLENRQLLLTFFVMVGFCGIFFALGYVVGRNTLTSGVKVAPAASSSTDASSKPSPMPAPLYANEPPPAAPAGEGGGEPAAPATDLNFYQSVEEKAPEAKLTPAEPAASAAAASAQPVAASASAAVVLAQTAAAPAAPGFLVQVSALTRREDASTLVSLLQGKKLPVQVIEGPGDKLFHVVVGPYPAQKQAEQTKSLLEQDGFRPIIKR